MVLVQKELKNAYIGEYGWTPGANTLLYLPLNSTDTYTDKSGNNVGTTNQGVTFGTYQGVNCGIFAGNYSNGQIIVTPFKIPSNSTTLFWCYMTGYDQSDAHIISGKYSNTYYIIGAYETEGFYGKKGTVNIGSYSYAKNKWILCAFTTSGTTGIVYLLGNNLNVTQQGSTSTGDITPQYFAIGNIHDGSLNRHFQGGLSNIIIESRTRTAQEIADYYNLTKSNYGL